MRKPPVGWHFLKLLVIAANKLNLPHRLLKTQKDKLIWLLVNPESLFDGSGWLVGGYRMKKESMDARESDPAPDRICLAS